MQPTFKGYNCELEGTYTLTKASYASCGGGNPGKLMKDLTIASMDRCWDILSNVVANLFRDLANEAKGSRWHCKK